MQRLGEELSHGRSLDDLTGIHHGQPLGGLGDHAQVMGDQEHRQSVRGLHGLQQPQHLRLDGDIERRGRLVGDQESRIAGQGHGDHDALFHPARELMRILVQPLLGVGDADGAQEFDRPLGPEPLARLPLMQPHRLADLGADGQHRIERGLRLLEDHRHPAAAHLAHLGFGQGQEFGSAELRRTGRDPPGRRQQTHQRQRRHRLAAARLAEQGEGLAATDVERQPIDHARGPGRITQLGRQSRDVQERLGHRLKPLSSADRRHPGPHRRTDSPPAPG